jgi:MFS family permease
MDILNHFSEVSWIAVVAATVAAFLLGGVWYSKKLFANQWMQEIGLTEDSIDKTHIKRTFITTFVLQFIAATALAVFIGSEGTWFDGMISGVLIGLLWIATAYGVTYLFEQRSMRIFFINAGYYVVLFSIMGGILGGWQ